MSVVLQGLIAYLPEPNKRAERLTRESVQSAVQMGFPLTVWHAHEKGTNRAAKESIRRSLGFDGLVLDYVNGNLAENWMVVLDTLFGQGADWVLWSSNDVVWNHKARQRVEGIAESGDRKTMYLVYELAAFMIHRELWEEVRPWYDTDWPPSGYEDFNFHYTAVWRGGKLDDTAFNGCYGHEKGTGVRLFPAHGYQRGLHMRHEAANRQKFRNRWLGGGGGREWPVKRVEPADILERYR